MWDGLFDLDQKTSTLSGGEAQRIRLPHKLVQDW
ncbi:MAG: hypothetical protein CM1200mP30_28230 [Pseudomonadota bacterium]|nr:MAG: hypothetical protein CM1200mP30_28230 [Pseudomonadota bacterium]